MTTTQTTKTDRDRFYEAPPRGTEFLREVFGGNRLDDFISGMKAFADEWFTNYTDEQNLPACWHALVELAGSDLYMEVDELQPEDEDDDE